MENELGLEWDESKRQATLAQRGLDFEFVAHLEWETALTFEDTRNGETRFTTMGLIKGRLCVVAWCYRGKNLRVISLRKANEREVKRYEQS